MREVYVVMGNDYLDAVFSTQKKADDYIQRKIDTVKCRHIYWQWYKFVVQ